MKQTTIKLSILDDKRAVTGNFNGFFQKFPFIQTTVLFNSLNELLKMDKTLDIDILILDEESIQIPTYAAIEKIKSRFDNMKIILMTMSKSKDYLDYLLTSKADYIIANSDEIESVLQAIIATFEGRGKKSFEINRVILGLSSNITISSKTLSKESNAISGRKQ